MKRRIACTVLIASLALAVPHAAGSEGGVLKGAERIPVATGQGFFPVALRLQDGRIAIVLRGGAPHLGIGGRLDIVFSADEGRTWGRPLTLPDSPADDRNPAFGQAKDGTLVVAFWRTARYDDQGRYNEKLDKPIDTWVTRSADGGKTWSAPEPIDVSDIGWGSPYGRIVTMPDGRMLMNIYGGPVRQGAVPPREIDNSYIYRSADNGRTWKRFARPGSDGYNETALLHVGDGKMLAAMRTAAGGETWLARSSDGGATWEKSAKIAGASIHPPDLTLLPDGRVLMVVGYRVGPFGVRGLVSDASLAFDWNRSFALVSDATNSDCGYPSSVRLKDGRILTAYYAVGVREHPQWQTHCGAVLFELP